MDKVQALLKALKERYYVEKEWGDPFEVLISCLLSQRTRDENTGKAARALFARARTPERMLRLSQESLEASIRPAGFYRQKALRIREICQMLICEYNGEVPDTREELMSLPGIGYKCADIVLMYGHGVPAIAVDTHCNRIPKRLGIVPEDASLEEVKSILEKLVPRNEWYLVNHGIVRFGQTVCRPVGPRCPECPINGVCEYYANR